MIESETGIGGLLDEVWLVVPNAAATLIDDPVCVISLPGIVSGTSVLN